MLLSKGRRCVNAGIPSIPPRQFDEPTAHAGLVINLYWHAHSYRELNMTTLNVNGRTQTVNVDPSTPILWALRDTLGLTGTKFGCGAGLCGACTVHLEDQAIRACVTPVSAAEGKRINTVESVTGRSDRVGQAVHQAWVKHDVAQCGYCQSGQIMSATAFLKARQKSQPGKQPSAAEIDAAMAGNICRCGTYVRIRAAVTEAAKAIV